MYLKKKPLPQDKMSQFKLQIISLWEHVKIGVISLSELLVNNFWGFYRVSQGFFSFLLNLNMPKTGSYVKIGFAALLL